MTNPSRFLSQGLEALVGSWLRLERARQAMKPPIPEGMMAASAPPANIRSASPLWMCSAALQTTQRTLKYCVLYNWLVSSNRKRCCRGISTSKYMDMHAYIHRYMKKRAGVRVKTKDNNFRSGLPPSRVRGALHGLLSNSRSNKQHLNFVTQSTSTSSAT